MQSNRKVDFFEMNVPFLVTGFQGEEKRFMLDHTFDGEEFTIAVDFEIADIIMDPEFDLISKNNTVGIDIEAVAELEIKPSIQKTINKTTLITAKK